MSRRPSSVAAQPTAGDRNLGKLARVTIAKVGPNGKINTDSIHPLRLNPESIEDEKTSNWVANQIPGQSNPIFQWVSGGPRVVSFDALVTKDTSDFLILKDNPLGKLKDKAFNAIGAIASNFLGVTVTASTFDALVGTDIGQDGTDLNIGGDLDYFRSLQYPTYEEGGRLATSPPIIVLYFGSTLSQEGSDPPAHGIINAKTDLWILLDLKIKITKQLPNLAPMEAVVSFRFNQYTTTSFGSNHFVPDPSRRVPKVPGLT